MHELEVRRVESGQRREFLEVSHLRTAPQRELSPEARTTCRDDRILDLAFEEMLGRVGTTILTRGLLP